jgi:hypothetical protein
MKTIKQAAREYWREGQLGFKPAADTESAFIAGVAFAQRWISVDEELPPDRENILIKCGEEYVIVAGYYMEENRAFYCPYISYSLGNATHWRPIELK